MSNLGDKLLREDGIDATGVSQQEIAWFRTVLSQEQMRTRKLRWLAQLPAFAALGLLLAVSWRHGLWEWLAIAPVAVAGVVVLILVVKMSRSLRISAATCLFVFAAVAVVLFLSQPKTVYARALANVKRAESLHTVGYGFKDGVATLETEIWYRPDAGTHIRWQRGDEIVEMYDDGRHRYEHVQGKDYAVRKIRRGQLLPRELTEPLRYLKDSERDTSRDKTVDGQLWSCYRRESSDHLALMWVDPSVSFRRYEEYSRQDDQWRQIELEEVSYDDAFELEMPPAVFERQGVHIIDPEQALRTRYSLENAVATREVLGLVFAVHEIQQWGEYRFVTCSVRPTEQSQREFAAAGSDKPGPAPEAYGRFSLSNWWQRREDGTLESRPHAMTELGCARLDGVDLCWYVLLPRGYWPGQDTQLDVCAYVHTDGALRKLRQEKGLEWYGQFRPLVKIDLPNRQSDLAAIAADLYGLGHLVTSVSTAAQNLFVSDASGVSQEEFRRRLESTLNGLRPMRELWEKTGSDLTVELVDDRREPVPHASICAEAQWSGGRLESMKDGRLAPPLIADEKGQSRLSGPTLFDGEASQDTRQMLYVVDPGKQLAGLYAVSGRDFGRPVRIVLEPACRVQATLTCPGLPDDATPVIHARLSTSVRRGYSMNGIILSVLTYDSDDGSLSVLLPPGEYELNAYATHDGLTLNGQDRFQVPPNTRDLNLGTITLSARR
ncbi:MAG: hypothetical protein JW741_19840 [Sedimentisphaerales bacterium]|nr:hypothetical protein [Sedimentisphaerales bacterium]